MQWAGELYCNIRLLGFRCITIGHAVWPGRRSRYGWLYRDMQWLDGWEIVSQYTKLYRDNAEGQSGCGVSRYNDCIMTGEKA